jgi:hypothetical protein
MGCYITFCSFKFKSVLLSGSVGGEGGSVGGNSAYAGGSSDLVALATAEPVVAVVVEGSLDRQREEKFPRRT